VCSRISTILGPSVKGKSIVGSLLRSAVDQRPPWFSVTFILSPALVRDRVVKAWGTVVRAIGEDRRIWNMPKSSQWLRLSF
jgi:hypothetical protein